MKEHFSCRVLKVSLYVIFVLGIIGTLTLPFMLEYYMRLFYDYYALHPGYRTFLLVFMTSVAIPGLWVVWEMILMMRSIPLGPFIMRNVRALRRIGIIMFVISAMFIAKLLLYFTFLTMACGVLFLILAFFALTLSNLFHQAVIYKEENDLTI